METFEQEYRQRSAVWSDIQGHLPFLYDQVVARPQAKVIELGVRWGTSAAAFLAAAEKVDGHVWSTDIVPPQVPTWWIRSDRWTLIIGDDLDPNVLQAQPTDVDVMLIDTSHAYRHTLKELRAYVPRMKPGGVVLCHDTDVEAPEQVGEQPPFPVALALDTYCTETGLSWENRPGSCGMGVLHIPLEES